LVNKVLRNDGFETGEVVELENLATIDQAVLDMDRDVHANAAAQQGETPYTPLVKRLVNVRYGAAAHRVDLLPRWPGAMAWFFPIT
jgi:hypothetical protein